MMMEQQMTLNHDEMQEKWKKCVSITCYAFRFSKIIADFTQKMIESIKRLVCYLENSMKELSKAFDVFRNSILPEDKDWDIDCKNVKTTYNKYVSNLKVNTYGFPRHIRYCARSRC